MAYILKGEAGSPERIRSKYEERLVEALAESVEAATILKALNTDSNFFEQYPAHVRALMVELANILLGCNPVAEATPEPVAEPDPVIVSQVIVRAENGTIINEMSYNETGLMVEVVIPDCIVHGKRGAYA